MTDLDVSPTVLKKLREIALYCEVDPDFGSGNLLALLDRIDEQARENVKLRALVEDLGLKYAAECGKHLA